MVPRRGSRQCHRVHVHTGSSAALWPFRPVREPDPIPSAYCRTHLLHVQILTSYMSVTLQNQHTHTRTHPLPQVVPRGRCRQCHRVHVHTRPPAAPGPGRPVRGCGRDLERRRRPKCSPEKWCVEKSIFNCFRDYSILFSISRFVRHVATSLQCCRALLTTCKSKLWAWISW